MINKKTQQRVDFIVEQRARLDRGFKGLRKLQAEGTKKHKRLTDALIAVEAELFKPGEIRRTKREQPAIPRKRKPPLKK